MTSFAMRGAALAVLLISVLAGCVREPSGGLATPSVTATATEFVLLEDAVSATPVVTGTVRAGASRTGTPASGTPAASGTRLPRATATSIVIQAQSARVTLGRAYAFQLSTRCGIDFSVDFDASFWDAASTRPAGIGNPLQKGTMTLVDAKHAKFSFDKGSVSYTRHTGVKVIPYVCN